MADEGEQMQALHALREYVSSHSAESSEMQALNALRDYVSSHSSGSRSRDVSAMEFAAGSESSEIQVAVRDTALVLLLGHLLNAKQRLDKALGEVENELDSAMAEAAKIEGLQILQRRGEREHLKQMLQLGAKASPISSVSPCLTHSHRRSSSMTSIVHPKPPRRSISSPSLLHLY